MTFDPTAIDDAIDAAHHYTREELTAQKERELELERDRMFHKLLLDEEERDAKRWDEWARKKGPRPSGGKALSEWLNGKARFEAEEFRRERDEWIERNIGPIRKRRKLSKEERDVQAMDPERGAS